MDVTESINRPIMFRKGHVATLEAGRGRAAPQNRLFCNGLGKPDGTRASGTSDDLGNRAGFIRSDVAEKLNKPVVERG
jgi:hypothetical protein